MCGNGDKIDVKCEKIRDKYFDKIQSFEFESHLPHHEKKPNLSIGQIRLFSNEVRLTAHEVMLRIVKLLRSEVSADASGACDFTLCEAQYFTKQNRMQHV